ILTTLSSLTYEDGQSESVENMTNLLVPDSTSMFVVMDFQTLFFQNVRLPSMSISNLVPSASSSFFSLSASRHLYLVISISSSLSRHLYLVIHNSRSTIISTLLHSTLLHSILLHSILLHSILL